MVSISLITFVGKDCVQARHALSLFCLWSAAVSLRSPMSIFRTASQSSLYVPQVFCFQYPFFQGSHPFCLQAIGLGDKGAL